LGCCIGPKKYVIPNLMEIQQLELFLPAQKVLGIAFTSLI
jgi:hypothetical protein